MNTGHNPDDDAPDVSAGPEVFTAFSMSSEDRRAAIAAVTAMLETAGKDFGVAVRALETTAAAAEVVSVMGAMTMYLGSAEAGTNPEHDRPLGIYQHHLELTQAVLLRHGTDDNELPPSRHIEPLATAIKTYNNAWILLQLQKVERANTVAARDLQSLLAKLRLHASTNRGWGYESRMHAMLTALLEPLSEMTEDLGFSLVDLPAFWYALRDRINERFAQHRAAVREALEWSVDDRWLDRIAQRFGRLSEPEPGWWTSAARTDDEVRLFYVINCSNLRAHEIYRFALDDLVEMMPGSVAPAVIRSIIDAWALRPGEDTGIGMQHLPLENPVVGHPFVRSGEDVWHLFCGWLTLHNPFELIERLLQGHEQHFATYLERRADFLEQRLAELLSEGLPGALVERSLLSTDPTDGKLYENDVVALISSFAVVAEAKAGRLHPDVRRGRPRVLRDRVDELLVRPSEQALRLAKRLETEHCLIAFRRKADGSVLEIDAADIRRTLTLAVTLEPLADLLPRLSEVATAGLSDRAADALSYNINILDLELVVELLDHPSEILHYLGRRAEIEQRMFLNGDEVDLLALYLQTGFNIGEREFTGHDLLDVTGLSDQIDVWHYRQEAGMQADKPRADRIAWWEAVLTRVEQRAGYRWAEVGVTMCNVAPPEQKEFENAMHELRRSILAGERPATDMIVFHNGPEERRDVFIGMIVTSSDPDERQQQYRDAIASATAQDSIARAILLAWTPAPINAPYFALVVYDGSNRPPT